MRLCVGLMYALLQQTGARLLMYSHWYCDVEL